MAHSKLTVNIPRPPGCECGDAECDSKGNVLKVSTCPVCMGILLDSMRGTCYSETTVRDGEVNRRVLLKQREFFSLDAYAPSVVAFSAVASTMEDH